MYSCNIENKFAISLDTLSIIGTVKGVNLNKSSKKVKGFFVESEERDNESFIDVKRIIGMNDYITVKKVNFIEKEQQCTFQRLSFDTPIIDTYGKRIALIKDINFDTSGKIININGFEENIDNIKISMISKDFILISNEKSTVKPQKNNNKSIASIDFEDKLGSYHYLLHKVVTKTIVDSYMTPIILRNTLVTEKIIEIAIANGKIIELILNTN